MKREVLGALALLTFQLFSFGQNAQEIPDEPLRETVDIVAVEVPVRVSHEGKPVFGLTRDDFTLYENGKKQVITDFYITRKQLQIGSETETDAEAAVAPAPRFFVLVFRCYDFNDTLLKGLRTTFQNILRPRDQLVVFINNSTLNYAPIADKQKVEAELETTLRSECYQAKARMLGYLKQVEQESKLIKMNLDSSTGMASSTRPSQIVFYLKKYLDLWKEYKKMVLEQDLGSYYRFASLLEQVKMEKWVLNFYQLEMIPRMSLGRQVRNVLEGYVQRFAISTVPEELAVGRSIAQTLQDIDRSLSVCADFPSEQAAKLFNKVNATFHTIFLNAVIESLDEDIEFRQVSTDIENTLRELTHQTGGNLITSTDIPQSLAKISEMEDLVYTLAYVPSKKKSAAGKVKVKLSNSRYDLFYDDNQREDYIRAFIRKQEQENPSVRFQNLEFKDKRLLIGIDNFKILQTDGKSLGRLEVRIQIKTDSGTAVFDKGRQMETTKQPVSISLDFSGLIAGKYTILVTVRDLLSGKSCQDLLQPTIR